VTLAPTATPAETAPAGGSGFGAGALRRALSRGAGTPTRLRALLVATVATLAAWGIATSLIVAQRETNTSRAVDAAGQVLVAAQRLQSDVAEADAASTANYLAPDREQRRLYLAALDSAAINLEKAARNAADDTAIHQHLAAVGSALIRYGGAVERATALRGTGALTGNDLQPAIDILTRTVRPEVEALSTTASNNYSSNTGQLSLFSLAGLVASIVALAILVGVQAYIAKKHRRLLNLPLLAATVSLLFGSVWLGAATYGQHRQLADTQRRAYQSLSLISTIRADAYELKTAEALHALGATAATKVTADEVTAKIATAAPITDSQDEAAAAQELQTRWTRYVADNAKSLRASDTSTPTAAALASGPSNASFGAFNAVLDGVLVDNQTQFDLGLADTKHRLNGLRLILAIASALAVVLAAWGIQLRLREFR
jgi:hypothetical protein